MIITKLTLNNFRVFCGTHEINLTPAPAIHTLSGPLPGTEKPIILFGGLNGAGKTSILTAIRLALFGKQSFEKLLSNQEYIRSLTELIHRENGADKQQNQASIELEFKYSQNGKENIYKITRAWKKGKKDTLSLEKNGTLIPDLTYEQCQGFLSNLIPVGVAELFFFDGEKIASLAEDKSGAVLKTAMRRLLGLDIIEKLKADLDIFLRQQSSKALDERSISIEADLIKSEVSYKRSAKRKIRAAKRFLEIARITTEKIEDLERKLSEGGGAWARTRQSESDKVDQFLRDRTELEKTIRTEMEASLPVSLAPKTMAALLDIIQKEKQIKQKVSFGVELDSFLSKLREKLSLKLQDTSSVAMETITECFKEHVDDVSNTPLLFDISDRQADTLNYLITVQSQSSYKKFDDARHNLKRVEQKLDNASENLKRAPEQEMVQKLFDKVRQLDKKKEKATNRYYYTMEEAKRELKLALDTSRQIQKLHDKKRIAADNSEGIENARQALILLKKFSEELTRLRVKQLEFEFEKSYKRLASKKDLLISAHIDPETCDVELIDEFGVKINRKLMSAGEKQIYAISILEALGHISGRKLPVVIDTPLGRLDSEHREKLIENYFPFASHQVIILSTDTEIIESYFTKLLQDDIARTYEICFNGRSNSSTLKEGYFRTESIKEGA